MGVTGRFPRPYTGDNVKIKMLVGVAGDDSIKPGDIIDVPSEVAVQWVKFGSAIEVEVTPDKQKTEKATRSTDDVERAVLHEG